MDARELSQALEIYEAAGFDTLPLLPNTRTAFLNDWQDRAPREMWQHAPKDSNVGIRCGGRMHLTVIDADNKKRADTSANISNFLTSLGILDCPIVRTPNDGRHFYLALKEECVGAWRQLSSKIGAGELRYGHGALVAAPPSAIGERSYNLLAGQFTRLPSIHIADLVPLLGSGSTPGTRPLPGEPRKLSPHPSRKAWRLLNGQDLENYKSRSEHEQSLITSLVNSGYEFDEILSLFLQYPCGDKFRKKYAEKPHTAIGYLKHSFETARQWTAAHEGNGRQLARAAIAWADSHPWPGRTGAVDRAVFMAHTAIAYRSGRVVYAASCRDLAESAAIRATTASKATRRLRKQGLIVLVQEATFHLAQTFQLGDLGTLSNPLNMGECTNHARGIGRATTLTSAHDAFRFHALGKIGAAVWEALSAHSPLTVQEISAQSGRSLRAVRRALARMFQLQMVGMDLGVGGETWYAVATVNLDDTARTLGTFGAAERQRAEHRTQRAQHRKKYAGLNAQSANDDSPKAH